MNNLFYKTDPSIKIITINDSYRLHVNILAKVLKDIIEEEAKKFIATYPFVDSIKFSVGTYYNDEEYSDYLVANVYANITVNNRSIRIDSKEPDYSWEDLLIYNTSSTEEELFNEKMSNWFTENAEVIKNFNVDLYDFYSLLRAIDTKILQFAYDQVTVEITKDGVEFYDYEY